MAIVLGLLVAASYGAADFLGGLASRRSPTASVVVCSQALGLLLMSVLVAGPGGGEPATADLVLGAASGLTGGAGLVLLYHGLAIGRMGVVAPITAVGAALVPLLWGLVVLGEQPGAWALAGAGLAVVSVALISRTPDDARSGNERRSVLEAAGASVCFGSVFVLLGETGPDSGMWPLVAARLASVFALGGGALLVRARLRPRSQDRAAVAAAGVLDVTANALFLLAVRRGLLSLVAVLSSLYPAGTVILARVVLQERVTKLQAAGLLLAGTGVALIAAG